MRFLNVVFLSCAKSFSQQRQWTLVPMRFLNVFFIMCKKLLSTEAVDTGTNAIS